MSYESPPLKASTLLLLARCDWLDRKHMSDETQSRRRWFAMAFFQGVAETFAQMSETELANQAVSLSAAISQHGLETVAAFHLRKDSRNV